MEPEIYLGSLVKKWHISFSDDPSKVRWTMSSEDYVIRVLRWICELGIIDIMVAVSILSRYIVACRLVTVICKRYFISLHT
jgi:hypothetical protein